MKTALALLWLLIVPISASMLLAMSDSRVGGPDGLADLGVAFSVAAMAFSDLGLLLIALAAWHRRGFRAFLLLAVPMSLFIALFVTAAGAGSDTAWPARVGSFVLLGALVFASFVLALWPITCIWQKPAPASEASS